MVGIWLSVSVWLDAACSWMSILSVLDIALILRFTGVSFGWPRFLGIFLGVISITFASQWLIAANAFGLVMGVFPLEAAQQIGWVLAWEFTRLRLEPNDMIFLAVTIISTVYFGFRFPK